MIDHDQREDYDDIPAWGPLAPEYIVRWPASIMWVFGLLQFIATQLWLAFFAGATLVVHFVDDGKTTGEYWDTMKYEPAFWLTVAGWPVATACTITVMRGANDLKRFRCYPRVVAGATLTLLGIPFFYLAVIQFPLGIWLFWLLLRRDVRARFEAVARRAISSQQT
jgi:hypothetical protein